MSPVSLRRVACAAATCFAASVASAAFVTFVENPNEVSPIAVTTNLVSGTGGSPTINSAAETASVVGFHSPFISTVSVPQGTHSAGLFEPGTTTLSDLVIVVAGPVLDECEIAFQCQQLTVTFYSDTEGGPPLESLIPAGSFGGGLQETGGLQNLSALLGTLSEGFEGLTVNVQSDLDQPAVPEPGSLALIGLGLAAMGWRRRTRA